MTDQQNDGDATAIERRNADCLMWAGKLEPPGQLSPDGAAIVAHRLAQEVPGLVSELEAVRLELGELRAKHDSYAANALGTVAGLRSELAAAESALAALRAERDTAETNFAKACLELDLQQAERERVEGVARFELEGVEQELKRVRLELEEAKAGAKDRWDRDTQRLSNLCEKLSAVESALTTERARAEEAETRERAEAGERRRVTRELAAANARAEEAERQLWLQQGAYQLGVDEVKRLDAELAAANARAGALKAAVSRFYDKCRELKWHEQADTLLALVQALSTASQASTDSRPPMATGFTEADRNTMTHVCRKCGKLNMGSCATCATVPQASTEQGEARCTCSYSGDAHGKHEGHARTCPMRPIATSPIPQVAQASAGDGGLKLFGRCAYTIGSLRCGRELGHGGAHVCPDPTLMSELAAANARVEEAERRMVEQSDAFQGAIRRMAEKYENQLAAANARAERLEAQLSALQQELGLPRVLTSAAPQASTEQVERVSGRLRWPGGAEDTLCLVPWHKVQEPNGPRAATASDLDEFGWAPKVDDTRCPRCGSPDRGQRCRLYRGGSQAGTYDCANAWHELNSPIPQVAQASGETWPDPLARKRPEPMGFISLSEFEPAQPKLCHMCGTDGPAVCPHLSPFMPAQPKPSEPLPDYVTRGELVAALRWTAAAYTSASTPPAALVELADRLENHDK